MSKEKGRRIAFLEKVAHVQEVYQLHKKNDGITDRWIHKTHVKPVFHIGYRSMKNYLQIPAKRELKRITEPCNVPSE